MRAKGSAKVGKKGKKVGTYKAAKTMIKRAKG